MLSVCPARGCGDPVSPAPLGGRLWRLREAGSGLQLEKGLPSGVGMWFSVVGRAGPLVSVLGAVGVGVPVPAQAAIFKECFFFHCDLFKPVTN